MLKKYRPARLVLGGKRPGQPWRPRRYSDLRSQNHRVRWSDRHVDGAKSKDTQRNRARADLRAHVHEAVSPARPPVSLRTYPPIRNPQQSCTTQGSRTFQSLPSRRPAATSRTTWRNTKRGFDTHLRSRAGHLPRLWRGNTSARLRTDSDVAYPRSIQHQHEGTMNARPIRRSISGPRSAAQISLQICLRTLVDRPVGSPSLSEDSRPHRTARATPSAPSAEPSETQNIHLTRQHHSSNTPSPQIPRLSPTQAFRSRRASGEVHSGTAAEALLFVRRLRATTDGSQR